ncbi:MAG: carbonic anhydrase, partial [Verrucomicrobiales bacterium]|nr:carbonic anhydrase [Verrucomicrobiales bacterium]
DHDELLHDAMLANVRASVDQLRHGSAILENLVQNHGLQIVGAEYSIETGQVDFLENSPEAS